MCYKTCFTFAYMIKAISHIILSILVLTVSVGITINKHYSNGDLYSYTINGEAESCLLSESETCGISEVKNDCEMQRHTKQESRSQTSCSCEDTSEYLFFDVNYIISKKQKIRDNHIKQIIVFANTFLNSYSSFSDISHQINNVRSNTIKTPNFTSLFQVFLC